MTEYLIAFNDEWVPDHTDEELREKSRAVKPLVAEMRAAGVLIFTGGLDDTAPVFSVDASSGTPVFTDGPFVESKEHLGGFAVVDVADEEARGCGRARSRWPAVGRRRCDGSRSPRNFRRLPSASRWDVRRGVFGAAALAVHTEVLYPGPSLAAACRATIGVRVCIYLVRSDSR